MIQTHGECYDNMLRFDDKSLIQKQKAKPFF